MRASSGPGFRHRAGTRPPPVPRRSAIVRSPPETEIPRPPRRPKQPRNSARTTNRNKHPNASERRSMISKSYWSGQPDSNRRPEVPKTSALPGCAIPRFRPSLTWPRAANKPTRRAVEAPTSPPSNMDAIGSYRRPDRRRRGIRGRWERSTIRPEPPRRDRAAPQFPDPANSLPDRPNSFADTSKSIRCYLN